MGDAARRSADARLGRTLGDRWTLERLIGVGGTAAVYAARHRNGKRVAVKVLHPDLSSNAERVRRFLREGYAANAVGHPNIVKIDDDGVDTGSAFLVMELLEGESLEAKLERDGPLDAEEAAAHADRLLDALASVHDRGIVHRDIKPENLFVTIDGDLKVLDFGIARLRDGSESSTETRDGAIMGTPAYMAPEQARGRWDEVDTRTDLWAVGATLFTLLTGEHVHEAETPNEQLGLAMTAPARSLRRLAPQLPGGLLDVVENALAYDREDRPESALAMQQSLRAAVAGSGAPPKKTVSRVRKRPLAPAIGRAKQTIGAERDLDATQPGRAPLVFVAGAAAVVLGGVAIVALAPGHAPRSELRTPSSTASTTTTERADDEATEAVDPDHGATATAKRGEHADDEEHSPKPAPTRSTPPASADAPAGSPGQTTLPAADERAREPRSNERLRPQTEASSRTDPRRPLDRRR